MLFSNKLTSIGDEHLISSCSIKMIQFNHVNTVSAFWKISEGLRIYSDSCIIILSIALVVCCNVACMIYHFFMNQDEENSFRLLNIFYGQLGKI